MAYEVPGNPLLMSPTHRQIPRHQSGFYRENGTNPVFYLNQENRTFCHVVNPDQMDLFGGFSLVKVVNNHRFLSPMSFIGDCTVASGYYRQNGTAPVYYVNATTRQMCHVANEAQMECLGGFGQVKVVINNGFQAGVNYIGDCRC